MLYHVIMLLGVAWLFKTPRCHFNHPSYVILATDTQLTQLKFI